MIRLPQPAELLKAMAFVALYWALHFAARVAMMASPPSRWLFPVPFWVASILLTCGPALVAGALSGWYDTPRGGTRMWLWMGLLAGLGPAVVNIAHLLALPPNVTAVGGFVRVALYQLVAVALVAGVFVAGGLLGDCARRQEEARAAEGRSAADETDGRR